MNRTPAGTGPGEPHALVIAKPGCDPVRLGPLTLGAAEDWAAALRARALSQAPEGTIVEVIPFDPAAGPFTDPDLIPRTAEALIGQLRADPGHPANGGFPDLYDRLVLVHGETLAAQLWAQACGQADAEAAYEEAERAAAADRAETARLLSQAHALAQQAGQKITRLLGTADAWDFDAAPGDYARHHAEAAARELRAASRALGG